MKGHEIVVIPGILRGQGAELDCLVRAAKVLHSGLAGSCDYASFEILEEESFSVPDGDYELLIPGAKHGISIKLARSNGYFIAV